MLKKAIFEQLFYQSSIAQIIFSEDYEEIIGNEAFYILTGCPQEELPAEYIHQLIHDLRADEQMEVSFQALNGASKVCLAHKKEIAPSTSPKTFHLQLTDITEKAQRERIIRLIADHSLDVINLHRLDGSYIYASPAVREIMGYEPHEMLNRIPYDFIHEEDIPHCTEKHLELLEKKCAVMMTYRIRRRDGTFVWLESSVKPIVSEDTGDITEIISVSRNIENRLKANELLEKSEKLAIIGRMSAAVAHEVRNPLTPIKGFIQLFQATKEYKDEYGEIILTELERVESIISEFLTMAEPHQKKVCEIDIVETVKKVITLLETEALLESKAIQFFVDQNEKYFIQGDLPTLKQVFVNVIQNALDAIPAKTGLVTIFVEKGQGEHVCIKVKDNGAGIEKERLAMLGEPFYSTKEKGIGLGLMTSFRIIENHQGSISFTSEMGKGTEVSIHLPLKKVLPTQKPQLQ